MWEARTWKIQPGEKNNKICIWCTGSISSESEAFCWACLMPLILKMDASLIPPRERYWLSQSIRAQIRWKNEFEQGNGKVDKALGSNLSIHFPRIIFIFFLVSFFFFFHLSFLDFGLSFSYNPAVKQCIVHYLRAYKRTPCTFLSQTLVYTLFIRVWLL